MSQLSGLALLKPQPGRRRPPRAPRGPRDARWNPDACAVCGIGDPETMAQLEAVHGVDCTCSEGLAGGAYSPIASERAYALLDGPAVRYDLLVYGDED